MRCFCRRVLTFGLSVCLATFIFINLYNGAFWSGSSGTSAWDSASIPERGIDGQLRNLPMVGRDDASFTRPQLSFRHTTERAMDIKIWPNKFHPDDDRILAQMKYVPEALRGNFSEQRGNKIMLLYTGMGGWSIKQGQQLFLDQKCPVDRCIVTANRVYTKTADVVLFKQGLTLSKGSRPSKQVWLLYLLESPYHTPGLSRFNNVFNWTATYRHDSTIVTPYEKFVPYNSSVLTKPQSRNYASGKTKKVAWFVSNCGAKNGRQRVAEELAGHIQVDIYGVCGPFKCPRYNNNHCFELLNRDYKFYLAFENSNCIDYITEKYFVNGLQNDIIPIVMGARPEDYRRASPPHSFIHVEDFPSTKALADYLHLLDQNDDLYNEYFQWKGTGSFVNTYFWCRLCALAHDTHRSPSVYSDINKWWRGEGVCIGSQRWDKQLSGTR